MVQVLQTFLSRHASGRAHIVEHVAPPCEKECLVASFGGNIAPILLVAALSHLFHSSTHCHVDTRRQAGNPMHAAAIPFPPSFFVSCLQEWCRSLQPLSTQLLCTTFLTCVVHSGTSPAQLSGTYSSFSSCFECSSSCLDSCSPMCSTAPSSQLAQAITVTVV